MEESHSHLAARDVLIHRETDRKKGERERESGKERQKGWERRNLLGCVKCCMNH